MNPSNQKVGILGPWQTYSHAAARSYLGSDKDLVCLPSIDAVFAGIITQELHSGIVPIWNSTCGLVSDTAVSILRRLSPPPGTCPATWWQCPLEAVDHIELPIHHCLAGFGKQEEIQIVTSKIQAIDQCREWLQTNAPHAELVPCESTAAGLDRAKEDRSIAVIASEEAALQSNTPILFRQIQDIADNLTEFLVIRRQEDVQERQPKSGDFEYWVGREKGTQELVTLPEILWSDKYSDFGQGYQFFKVSSAGGRLSGLQSGTNTFQTRWPLGWAASH